MFKEYLNSSVWVRHCLKWERWIVTFLFSRCLPFKWRDWYWWDFGALLFAVVVICLGYCYRNIWILSVWWWWVEKQNQERNLGWKDDIYAETWKVIMAQMLSCGRLFATPWSASPQASLSFPSSQSLPKLMSIESVMPSNHLILCCPLLFPPIFARNRVFSTDLALPIR